jgi:hypothetical protein
MKQQKKLQKIDGTIFVPSFTSTPTFDNASLEPFGFCDLALTDNMYARLADCAAFDNTFSVHDES